MAAIDTTPLHDFRAGLDLTGKGFVVIGAGQGIGRQTAHGLTQWGAKVVCVGRSAELTEAVAREIGGFACLGDATKRADLERIFAEAEGMLGAVHGVVNTLGETLPKPLMDLSDEEWDWQFDIVLRHAFLTTQIGGKALARSGGGTITFVGSTGGIVSNNAAYGAAKAALNQMVKAASVELGHKGIRINVVAPALVRTPRADSYLDDAAVEAVTAYYPVGRLALPADVASAILFMASDLSGYVTGQTLLADGGLLAQSPMPNSAIYGARSAAPTA